jgi:bis(5'-nucleosidyl)-tetraphosphatase
MPNKITLNRPTNIELSYSFLEFSNFVINQIDHGYHNQSRNKILIEPIYDLSFEDDYRLQRANQLLATKTGLSYDCVELYREYGIINGYETKSFYMEYYDSERHYHFYHSFIVIKLRDGLWRECPSNDAFSSSGKKGFVKVRELVADVFYKFKTNVRRKIKNVNRECFYINEFNKPDDLVFSGSMDYIDWCHIETIIEVKEKDEVSAMAVVIAKNNGNPKILLLQTVHREWVYPKGHIEAGEDSIDCAIRECLEESGVKLKRSNHIDKINEYCYSFSSFDLEITNDMFYDIFGALKIYKTVVVHGFMVDDIQKVTWNEKERFIGGGWFSLKEAKKMINFENAKVILSKLEELTL